MKKLLIAGILLATPAFAEEPQSTITINVSRQSLQIIGAGLMKLPYETSAPVLTDLQKQLEAANEKAKAAPAEEPKK